NPTSTFASGQRGMLPSTRSSSFGLNFAAQPAAFTRAVSLVIGAVFSIMIASASWRCLGFSWRRGSGSNRRIKVLQTFALPLGYRAEQRLYAKITRGRASSQTARTRRDDSHEAACL